jgi:hypothetical protein
MFRFKPMLKWPAEPDALYTVVLSNIDINSRRNRFVKPVLRAIKFSVKNLKSADFLARNILGSLYVIVHVVQYFNVWNCNLNLKDLKLNL